MAVTTGDKKRSYSPPSAGRELNPWNIIEKSFPVVNSFREYSQWAVWAREHNINPAVWYSRPQYKVPQPLQNTRQQLPSSDTNEKNTPSQPTTNSPSPPPPSLSSPNPPPQPTPPSEKIVVNETTIPTSQSIPAVPQQVPPATPPQPQADRISSTTSSSASSDAPQTNGNSSSVKLPDRFSQTFPYKPPPPPTSSSPIKESSEDKAWNNILRLRPQLINKKTEYLAWRKTHPTSPASEWIFETVAKMNVAQARQPSSPPTSSQQNDEQRPPPRTMPLWGAVRDLSGNLIVAGTLTVSGGGKTSTYSLDDLYNDKINLPPGRYQINAQSPGFRSPEASEWVIHPGSFTLQLFSLTHKSSRHSGGGPKALMNNISGTTMDANHTPLPHMMVRIRVVREDKENKEEVELKKQQSGFLKHFKKEHPEQPTSSVAMWVESDNNGHFSTNTTYLPPGTYLITCQDQQGVYRFQQRTIRVGINPPKKLEMIGFTHQEHEENRKKISGQTVDSSGKGLTGMAITITIIPQQALDQRRNKMKGLRGLFKGISFGTFLRHKNSINNAVKNQIQTITLMSTLGGHFSTGMKPLPDGKYFLTAKDIKGKYKFDKKRFTLRGASVKVLTLTGLDQKEEKERRNKRKDEEEEQRKMREKRKKYEEKLKKRKEKEENPNSLRNKAKNRFQRLKERVKRPFRQLKNRIKNTTSRVTQKIKNSVRRVVPKSVRNFFNRLGVKNKFGRGLNKISRVFRRFIIDPAQKLKQLAGKALNKVFNPLTKLWSKMWNNYLKVWKPVARAIGRFLGRMASQLMRFLGRMALKLLQFLIKNLVKLLQMAVRLAVTAMRALIGVVQAIVSGIQAAVGALVAGGWVVLLIILIIVLIIILVVLIRQLMMQQSKKNSDESISTSTSTGASGIPGLILEKSGDTQVDNGQVITYQIKVTYTGDLDVTIKDPIPENTEFVEASGKCIGCSSGSRFVSWRLKDQGSSSPYTFTLKVRPTKDDIYVINTVTGAAPGVSTNVGACLFYRGHNSPGVSYKSPKLISYFQEAEKLSGVPAVVLAAIAKVESDGPNFTDQSLDANQCPGGESPVGALGLMQIMPPGKVGHSDEGVKLGVEFLKQAGINVTYENLSRSNFCDPRQSIIMAAGFVRMKMKYEYQKCPGPRGDGTWNPAWNTDKDALAKVACTYYGALDYDGGNYGDDLWNSVNSCKGGFISKGPLSPDEVIQAYNITLSGFTATEEQSIRTALSNISGTNLLPLVKNVPIVKKPASDPSVTNYANGCDDEHPNGRVVLINTDALTVVHELAHIAQMCNLDSVTSYKPEFESANGTEGGISDYSRNVGSGTGSCPYIEFKTQEQRRAAQIQEDFAETVTYYLNPSSKDTGLCGAPNNQNPLTITNSDGSLKYQQHKSIMEQVIGVYP